jgi:hypothetical protein
VLWNPKIFYTAYKGLPLARVVSRFNPIPILTCCLFEKKKLILPVHVRVGASCLQLFRFKFLYVFLFSSVRDTHPHLLLCN